MYIYIVLFILELAKYWLMLNVLYSAKIKNKKYAIMAGVLFAIFLKVCSIPALEKRLILYLVIIVLQFITIEIIKISRNFAICMTVFCITCLDELASDLLEYVAFLSGNREWIENNVVLLGNSLILVMFLVLYLLKTCGKHIENGKTFPATSVNVFLLLMAVEILVTVTSLSYVKKYINNNGFYIFATVLCILSFFCIFVLVGLTQYVVHTNEKMAMLIEMEKKLRESQKNYYETLLDKERETRKYRHDISNHLLCLDELAKADQMEPLIVYIESLQDKLSAIQKRTFDTGNTILDILFNYHMNLLLDNVDVRIIGKCNEDIRLEEVDLCIVFSNIFQNAVEAINRDVNDTTKFISFHINQGIHGVSCRMINSITEIPDFNSNGIPETKKKDKEKHGLGLKNVVEIISRYEGLIDFQIEGNTFVCTIFLKN